MMKLHIINLDLLQNVAKSMQAGALRAVARNLADVGRDTWIMLASKELHSSRADYIAGIQKVVTGKNMFSVTLVGEPANMIEQGADAFRIHDTVLSDDATKWHTSKDGGRYIAIPFRHKTPTAGATGGQPMGSQFAARSAGSRAQTHTVVRDTIGLGRKIHKEAKKLKAGQRLPPGLAPKLRKHHSTDIFAGTKVELQPTSGRAQRTYHSFRTIAVDAAGNPKPPNKWMHPGINARNLVDKVAAHVAKVAPATFEAYVKGVMGG